MLLSKSYHAEALLWLSFITGLVRQTFHKVKAERKTKQWIYGIFKARSKTGKVQTGSQTVARKYILVTYTHTHTDTVHMVHMIPQFCCTAKLQQLSLNEKQIP